MNLCVDVSPWFKKAPDLRGSMDINCSDKELQIFQRVADAANELGFPCYLIGGFVRDKILGRPTKDADFVCVGDGLKLAETAAKHFSKDRRIQVSISENCCPETAPNSTVR